MPSIQIILPSFPSVFLDSVDTIAALRAQSSATIDNGQNIIVDGNAAVGDFGGGTFAWDELSTSNDDGVTIIKPTDVGPLAAGRWKLTGTTAFAGQNGSASIGFIQSGTGAVARTSQAKMRESTSDTDFATGLGAALTAVRNNDDNSFSGAVVLPNGLTDITTAIAPPQSFAKVNGTGGKTIRAMAAVDIFNFSGASHTNSRFSNFRTFNGVNVFAVSTAGEIASNSYVNLEMVSFTGDAFSYSGAGGVTSCLFSNIRMDSATGDRGIFSVAGINNDNTIDNVDATNLTDAFVKFGGTCNGLFVSNTRVEGGGVNGKAVYDLTTTSGVRIGTGWYEGHHEYFLKLNGTSTGTVTIDGIVDIGAKDGAGFKASIFDVGSNMVVFGTNEWALRTVAPLNCFISGINDRLYLQSSNVWTSKHQRGGKIHLRNRNRSVDGDTFDLLTFTRTASTPNDFTNLQILNGVLTISFIGPDAGGVARTISRTYAVQAQCAGSAVLTVAVANMAQFTLENAGAVTLTPQGKAGATATIATLELVISNVNAGFNSLIDATFEFSNATNLASNAITVTPT